jgi:predicted lipid carrier protein YhbT
VAFDVTGPTARRWAVQVADGRARPVPEVPVDPTTRVSADVATFMALACGRIDPDAALATGDVTVHGDEEVGTAVVRNLGYTI